MRLTLCFSVLFPIAIMNMAHANSDVYLATINSSGDSWSVQNVQNISQRKGYDNQPSFAANGKGLYYTAMFTTSESTQTDVLYYDFASQKHINISNSEQTSEYSPTEIDNGQALSVIKVEPDNKQRLWRIDIASGQQNILNASIEPVGYHAWGKEKDLALFVLGEPMTLQYITSIEQSKGKFVAGNIGRSIRYNHQLDAFSFSYGEEKMIASYHPKSNKIQDLLPLPASSEYYTWLNSETLLSADGSVIKSSKKYQDWQTFLDLSEYCPTKITRLAVNQAQTQLAFVCDEETL